MPPTNPFITDGTTFVNPIGLAFTLVMGLLLMFLPRRYALLPVIILICYMTMGMRIMVGGLNFTMIRILLIIGWIRLVLHGELRSIELNQIDKAMIWFTLSSIITHTLLWGNYEAFKEKLGLAYNALGFYFFFRFVLKDFDDIIRMFKMTAVLIVPLAGAMILEMLTETNPFTVFGGVIPLTITRDGVLRCQGPFAHPILAGTFGATLVPFFIALWGQGGRNKLLAFLGVVSSTIIMLASGSSGPLMAYACGILGLFMWKLRNHMREIRWGLALGLTALHLVMKAPVWFFIARIDVFSGSTGFHRALVIDRAFANLSDWWLVGTRSTASWADEDQHLYDVTNQYITYGADGGLITMVLFIMIIVFCFRGVGLAVRAAEKKELRHMQFCLWALGAALFSHTMNFLSVSYFDQNVVNWYMLLAMISTASGLLVFESLPARVPPSRLHTTTPASSQIAFAIGSAESLGVNWKNTNDERSRQR